MLRLQGLVKQYKTGDRALKGVELEVPDGQVMALIGPSGAGKSTLIRCVNRLVEPTDGKIYLGDLELAGLSQRQLRRARRRMGMIFQEYALVERLTVMENVLSGRLGYVGFFRSYFRQYPQADIDEAFRLLERVGLDHMVDKRAGRAIRRAAPAGRNLPCLDPEPRSSSGGRADGQPRPQDLAADHAVDPRTLRRAQTLRHHQYPRCAVGPDVRRAHRRPAIGRNRL